MSVNLDLLSAVTSGARVTRADDAAVGAGGPAKAGAKDSFGEALAKALDAVNADEKAADAEVRKLVAGENVDVHDVMLALEKADVSVRLMTQVGRRAVEAYRELMRMSV